MNFLRKTGSVRTIARYKGSLSRDLLLAVLFLLLASYGGAQDEEPGQEPSGPTFPNTRKYFTRNYFPIDYAGQNQMYEVVQDRRGVMYLGNNVTGVIEYDGVNWRTIALANNNTAYSLDIDSDGVVYVAGFGEVGYLSLENGVSVYRSLMDKVPEGYRTFGPAQVRATKNGTYFKAGDVILRWHSDAITVIKNDRAGAFENIFSIRDSIYTSDREGTIFKITADIPEVIFEEQPEVFGDYIFKNEYNMPSVNLMFPYDDDKILIGSYFRGLLLFDGKSLNLFETEGDEIFIGNMSYSGTIFGDEFIAIGTVDQGVVIVDKQGKLHAWINEDNGLINNGIFSIYADNQNFIWVGTSYGFSQILYPSPFSIHDQTSGIQGQVRMTASQGGTLYVVTSMGAFRSTPFSSILGLQFERLKGINPAETQVVKVLDKSILIGSIFGVFEISNIADALEGQGDITSIVERGDDYVVKAFTPLQDKDCRFIEISKRYPGIVYATIVGEGLYILKKENGKWTQQGFVPIDDPVFFGQEDTGGILWLTGVNTGCYRVDFSDGKFENPVIKNYYTDEGLPAGYYAMSVVADSVYLYSDEAFFKLDEKSDRFRPDTTFFNDGLLTGFVNEAPGGSTWITKGRPRQLSRALRGPDGSYRREYTPFQRFNRYQIRNFGYGDDGTTWFGSEKSLLAYDPNIVFDYKKRYRTIIRSIAVNEKPIFGIGSDAILNDTSANPIIRIKNNRILLPHDQNSIRFDYAGLYVDVEFPNQYQVQLEGLTNDWSRWTSASYKEFSNLDPGKYRFRARAKSLYGTESREAIYEFQILPPWWETWWFYVSEIGVLMSMLTASVVLNRTGEASKFSKTMTLVTIVVIFETVMFFAEPFAEQYGGSVPVVQLALNVFLALALGPAESLLEGVLIGKRRKRKYRIKFSSDGKWEGGSHIIPTLSDMSNINDWTNAFHKEFDDVGRKYARYVSNDWVLDDDEKGDLEVELEDLLGGLLLFRRYVTTGEPNEFSSAGVTGDSGFDITIFPDHWTGNGRIDEEIDFNLDRFVDSYQEMLTDVETMFDTYAKAMEDRIFTDEERTQVIATIEPVFCQVIVVVRALCV